MSAPRIITLGCRLNSFESEVLRRNAHAAGLEDAIIVNTCAVTAEAVRQARQAIRKARRAHPHARLIVTGCAAQLEPERFAAMAEVDAVLGNAEKLDRDAFRLPPGDGLRMQVGDIMRVRETAPHLIDGFEGRARAFVQIQNGCDHRCTFCIIPFARGPARSLPVAAVVEQARALVDAAGYREIVLTGVDISSYGTDLDDRPGLAHLCRALLEGVPGLARLRLSSLDPAAIEPDLIRLIGDEPRMAPHLHLSVQAGDDLVLKRMKRRHSRAQVIDLCAELRALRPEVVFGADLIAGFPTETDAMFENTRALMRQSGIVYVHVFPFSARPGTPAARMPQVAPGIRKARAARLRADGTQALARFLERQRGRRLEVLVERNGAGRGRGHSEHFAPVVLDREAVPGTLVEAVVTGTENGQLLAQICEARP